MRLRVIRVQWVDVVGELVGNVGKGRRVSALNDVLINHHLVTFPFKKYFHIFSFLIVCLFWVTASVMKTWETSIHLPCWVNSWHMLWEGVSCLEWFPTKVAGVKDSGDMVCFNVFYQVRGTPLLSTHLAHMCPLSILSFLTWLQWWFDHWLDSFVQLFQNMIKVIFGTFPSSTDLLQMRIFCWSF